jgi:hypothetical protein
LHWYEVIKGQFLKNHPKSTKHLTLNIGRLTISGHYFTFGVPTTSKILSIYSSSDYPVNRGFRFTSSAMMHPIPQISIVVVYFLLPRRTSGGLYHRVTTSFVKLLTGTPKARARPK